MTPTADDIARGYVAACRETGEDPLNYGKPTERGIKGSGRARHYLFQALRKLFPTTDKDDLDRLARLAGVRENQRNFWTNSNNAVFRPFVMLGHPERGAPHWARWFDDAVFARVIAAVEAGIPTPMPEGAPELAQDGEKGDPVDAEPTSAAPEVKPEPLPYRPPPPLPPSRPRQGLGTLEPCGYRPPADTIRRALEDETDSRPVFDRHEKFAGAKPREFLQPTPKRSLQDELHQAVLNTQKMAPPKE